MANGLRHVRCTAVRKLGHLKAGDSAGNAQLDQWDFRSGSQNPSVIKQCFDHLWSHVRPNTSVIIYWWLIIDDDWFLWSKHLWWTISGLLLKVEHWGHHRNIGWCLRPPKARIVNEESSWSFTHGMTWNYITPHGIDYITLHYKGKHYIAFYTVFYTWPNIILHTYTYMLDTHLITYILYIALPDIT